MPKTEAESVDDIVAARRRDGRRAKCMLVHSIPDIHQMKRPVKRAVSTTPTVESMSPGTIIGLIEGIRVKSLLKKFIKILSSESLLPILLSTLVPWHLKS